METTGTAGSKGVPRAQREQQILDVAIDELGRRGYAGASIAEIAEKAGISKPLIYGYFGSKEGLYVACVERTGATLYSAIEQVLVQTEPTIKLAEDTLRAVFTALQKQPHAWNVVYDRSVPEGSAAKVAAARVSDQIFDQASRGVTTILAAQGLTDPLDMSALTVVWASTVTALMNWWLDHPDQTAEQMTTRSGRILAVIAAPH
ncbi:TetR/AcrR family transcriptional regulator [Mycolicibacterium frederiksbergense]|uniref:TetR/AcrR family transcriptional regulator n=1 Tax=Mycolicibacterium frederiksbergense TaxID=117567 RepID=UPI00399C3C1C